MGNWPRDADGDVFRSLEQDGCDFSKDYDIDFFVDFAEWPPDSQAIAILKDEFGAVSQEDTEEKQTPCVQCKIHGKLTYDFVTGMQAKITERMTPYGGLCADWGVQI